jgi:sRNA-binding carbon storage regulator CsrA
MGLIIGRRQEQVVWIGEAKVIVKEFYKSPSGSPAVSLLIEAPSNVVVKRDEIIERDYLIWRKVGYDYVSQGGKYRVSYNESLEPTPYIATYVTSVEVSALGDGNSSEAAKKLCTAHHKRGRKCQTTQ